VTSERKSINDGSAEVLLGSDKVDTLSTTWFRDEALPLGDKLPTANAPPPTMHKLSAKPAIVR
jgi:hypothetical protein